MGIKERRERDKQKLQQSILQAARVIAAQEGWQAVTVRKVADRIEYSPPTLYEYFENKEAILQELVREGFQTLAARVAQAYHASDDPEERMVRMARAYCDFAWDHQELYEVMHGLGGAACPLGQPPPEFHEMSRLLRDAVCSAVQAGSNRILDLEAEMQVHWATLHGVVALTLAGQLPGGRDRATTLVEHATRGWLAGVRGGAPA